MRECSQVRCGVEQELRPRLICAARTLTLTGYVWKNVCETQPFQKLNTASHQPCCAAFAWFPDTAMQYPGPHFSPHSLIYAATLPYIAPGWHAIFYDQMMSSKGNPELDCHRDCFDVSVDLVEGRVNIPLPYVQPIQVAC
jgi:hypothetical protein